MLAEVAGALSGKENAAAEDAHALLTSGTLLEAGVAELAGLRAKRGERLGAASRDGETSSFLCLLLRSGGAAWTSAVCA